MSKQKRKLRLWWNLLNHSIWIQSNCTTANTNTIKWKDFVLFSQFSFWSYGSRHCRSLDGVCVLLLLLLLMLLLLLIVLNRNCWPIVCVCVEVAIVSGWNTLIECVNGMASKWRQWFVSVWSAFLVPISLILWFDQILSTHKPPNCDQLLSEIN